MSTPTEIYDEIRELAFDVDESLLSETLLYRLMSEAETIFLKKVPCAGATSTDSTVIDQREYTRPSGALKIHRITWNYVKLKKITIDMVDVIEGQSYGGVVSTGNLTYYYEYIGQIGFSPLPREVQTIKYWYVPIPTALDSDSTAFTIPPEYGHYLIDYCLWKAYHKDDKPQLADRSQNAWLNNIQEGLEDWQERQSTDEIEQVQLDEVNNTTDMGPI